MKGKPPTNIPAIMVQSMAELLNDPIDPSDVENPPVAIVVIAWQIASKGFMPANQRAIAEVSVKGA